MIKPLRTPIIRGAVRALKALASSDKGVRVGDISDRLNISDRNVFGMMVALEKQGALKRGSVTFGMPYFLC